VATTVVTAVTVSLTLTLAVVPPPLLVMTGASLPRVTVTVCVAVAPFAPFRSAVLFLQWFVCGLVLGSVVGVLALLLLFQQLFANFRPFCLNGRERLFLPFGRLF